MKKKINLLTVALINSILVLLGFAACSDNEDDDGGMVEYGTPSATYKVRGTAVDGETKQPVEGLRSVLYVREEYEGDEYILDADTVYTDDKGGFQLQIYYGWARSIELRIEDIDGEDNGLYGTYDAEVDFTDASVEHIGNWHRELSLDLGEIKMTEPEEPGEPEELDEPGESDE